MPSAWGNSWGKSWGNSWGQIEIDQSKQGGFSKSSRNYAEYTKKPNKEFILRDDNEITLIIEGVCKFSLI
jgi:hypothetical protein